MNNVRYNKNTLYFKLFSLKRIPARKLFLPQVLPNLTEHQRRVLQVAKERGYWNYPCSINLQSLAQELKVSKSTAHETLKRAEARLLDYYI